MSEPQCGQWTRLDMESIYIAREEVQGKTMGNTRLSLSNVSMPTVQPDRVKVRCVNPQPTLTGPCTWTGTRTGRQITTYRGRTFREPPTHKRCPKCGGPVKEAP